MEHGCDDLRENGHGRLCDIPNQIRHNEESISLTMGVNGARNAVRNFDIQFWDDIFCNLPKKLIT